MQLVAVPLTGANFLNWSRSIRRALGAKSKLELLDGTVKEPSPDSKYYKQWLRVDYMISCWIVNSISKDLVDSFSHYDTTKKLWDALSKRFSRSNGAKIAKLEKEIRNYMQGNQSIVEYFNNLNKLWSEMDVVLPRVNCVCHASEILDKREEDKRLVQFLLGLNENYEHSRSQILLMDPLPTVDKAYAMVTQIEDEKSINEGGTENRLEMAMYTQKQVGYRWPYGRGQSHSYQDRNNGRERRLSREEKRRLKCTNCKESGHEAHECFKLHGYPEWYMKYKDEKSRERVNYMNEILEDNMSDKSGERPDQRPEPRQTDGQLNQLDIAGLIQTEVAKAMSGMSSQVGLNTVYKAHGNEQREKKDEGHTYDGYYTFSIVASMDKTAWIIDSGASTHVCCNAEMMHTTYRLDKVAIVNLPDGSTKRVTEARTVRLNAGIVLHNVLFIPGFTNNLISVAQLIGDSGVRCVFHRTHCVFHDIRTDDVLGLGKMENNLYIFECLVENHFTHNFRSEDMTIDMWHRFLGHPSLSTLRHMKQLHGGFRTEVLEAIERCDVCMKAKQCRDPFPVLNRRTDTLFELVHADIWGPYCEESVSNTRFVLTLVEDHSRNIWTYLLSSKALVCQVLDTFINMIRTHFKRDIKFFRSDNGTEFTCQSVQQVPVNSFDSRLHEWFPLTTRSFSPSVSFSLLSHREPLRPQNRRKNVQSQWHGVQLRRHRRRLRR